ncbi:zf-TFIIB domain-containing protein [Hahella aquimaris]|uniref:TFIIB-type zinc ribbon-containing protein n=1 Tax=Hahella sp. HNIBRBA332 TaxID=3015983 RepID=UPI00273CF4DD|nr:zf-TFIIB domain-containing protein [Hahella sp. HNIBRBA332]WLQ12264.1 zf-TFIIB domain-containing protein [Hahella sp. HNIBRBA332]
MKCTSCNSGALKPGFLEDLLACHICDNCGGTLIYLQDYLRWLNSEHSLSEVDFDLAVNAEDSKKALLCPKTGRLMLKYRISKNTDHRLDLSPEILAMWLDKGEWDLLKQEGLATKLNAIFTDPWQRKIRESKARDVFEALYEEEFGKEEYAKLREVREWLDKQSKQKSMIAYLLAKDPYSANR